MGIQQMFAGIPTPSVTSLYTFTTFTFTNAGITGSSGPSLANCLSNYNTGANPWLNDTNYFNVTGGIQLWTVPETKNYEFTIEGGAGGSAYTGYGYGAFGKSAKFTTTLSLTQGHKIKILVGQMGANGNLSNSCGEDGSGGGGTFIYNDTTSTVLAVAGGGGGAGNNGNNREESLKNASNSTSGNKGSGSTGGAAGTGGNGGSIQSGSCVSGGGAGAGLSTNGGAESGMAAALSFLNGGTGGTISSVSRGGFGGGGARGVNYAAGGGGGYSGGGGGGLQTCSCNDMGNGGAGGSYSIATITSFSNPSSQTHGSCIVTKL